MAGQIPLTSRSRCILPVLLGLLLAPICPPEARGANPMQDFTGLIDASGSRLYVHIEGSGPPVVLLHGGASHFEHSFAGQIGAFAATRTVIGIDQRGHGHSPDTSAPFDYRQMAADTAAALQRIGVTRADFVGHSDGGIVALLLASAHPELVRRVVVSGVNVRGDFLGWYAYLRLRLMSLDSFAAGFAPAQREDYARVSPQGAAHWTTLLAKTKDLWATWRIIDGDQLRAIGAPVLVMAGDRDIIPRAHTEEILGQLAHGTLCILPDAGHMTMQDQADAFNRIVLDFLNRSPQG